MTATPATRMTTTFRVFLLAYFFFCLHTFLQGFYKVRPGLKENFRCSFAAADDYRLVALTENSCCCFVSFITRGVTKSKRLRHIFHKFEIQQV